MPERCEMCGRERSEGLERYAGLLSCHPCREGEPTLAVRAWGLRVPPPGGEGSARRNFIADVILATVIDAKVLLRSERLGGLTSSKASSAAAGFEHKVRVEEREGEALEALLTDPVVQQAALEALKVAHWIKLDKGCVRLFQSAASVRFEPERDLPRLSRAAVALGVAIERWARGAPDGQPSRAGCRVRGDGEWPAGSG